MPYRNSVQNVITLACVGVFYAIVFTARRFRLNTGLGCGPRRCTPARCAQCTVQSIFCACISTCISTRRRVLRLLCDSTVIYRAQQACALTPALPLCRRYVFCGIYSIYVIMIIVRYGFMVTPPPSNCV